MLSESVFQSAIRNLKSAIEFISIGNISLSHIFYALFLRCARTLRVSSKSTFKVRGSITTP